MKINLIQTVIVAWLGTLISCLHLQQQPRMYDPDQYLGSLQTVQDQLKTQLYEIKQKFQQLDETIKNAAYDPNQQLRLLQEGIADERDSLYEIQQYLTLPFNLRSCKCFNFSDEMRANLTAKLASVYQSLNQVENKAKECVGCQISFEVQTEIKYQKGYLKTMQDTVDSRCCKVYTILYNDNLNASNWFYDMTPAQYKAVMDQRIKNASVNDTFVRLCPVYTPYVTDDMKNCTVCEDQNLLFNLRTRKCEQCPIGKIFNYDKHRCEFDVVCPSGSQFNQDTVMCEKVQPTYNDSLCPPEAPIWNPQTLGCYQCKPQTPYYDTTLLKCTTCPQNTTYSSTTNECVHKDCAKDQFYNSNTQKCESRPVTSVEISNSHCPEDRPYWDKGSLSCSKCPITQPFYNGTSKACQTCPEGSTYDATRNLCARQCASGQQLNPVSMQCQNITVIQPVNDGTQISLCPPDRPIWNSQTKSCSQCASANPFWNDQLGVCQKCPVGQVWNETLKVCQNEVKATCPQGTNLNPSTGKCDQIFGSMAFCPPDRPFYNIVLMACTQCPLDKPNYDPSVNECKGTGTQPTPTPTPITCPTGFIYDQQSQGCKSTSPGSTIAQCPPATPIWDTSRGVCVSCPAGQQWDTTARACVNCPDPAKCTPTTSVTNTSCQYNYQWNSTEGKCVRCLAYQKYNPQTALCQNFCKLGEFYDSNYDTCSGTISKCPIGLIFNQKQLRCECPQGVSYRYSETTLTCEQFCKSNEYYDYLDQKCYPL